jgi:hypothetical protein
MDPDPLVKGTGTDPSIRIRFRTKMSRIQNTGLLIPHLPAGHLRLDRTPWSRYSLADLRGYLTSVRSSCFVLHTWFFALKRIFAFLRG